MRIQNIFTKKTLIAVSTLGAAGLGALAYTGKLSPLNAKVQALATAAMPHINALIAEAGSLANAAITHLTPYASAASTAAAEYIAMTGLTPLAFSAGLGLGVGATALLIIIVLLRRNRNLSKEIPEIKKTLEMIKTVTDKNSRLEHENSGLKETIDRQRKTSHVTFSEFKKEHKKLLEEKNALERKVQINEGQMNTVQKFYQDKSADLEKANEENAQLKKQFAGCVGLVDKIITLNKKVENLENQRYAS